LGGNDILNGSNSVDYLYGGSGDDQLKGENSGDFIYGGSGSDQISGGAGNDNLYGGSGADTIDGDNGSDLIVGGYGADQLTGGSGSNTFVYLSIRDSTPTEFDVITDWSAGTNKIDLSAIDANSSADGLQNFTSVTNTSTLTAHKVVWFYDVSSNETIIKADVNGDTTADLEIHLTGNITLHQSDFTLV
jgi:Ca2+-binding RTX toxin-like protein